MNNKEIESVSKLSGSKRYEYFIKKVADFEEVWGLYDNGWAVGESSDGNINIPFWPKKEFAQLCSKEAWTGYLPKRITLEDFMNNWLPGMNRDNRKPAIFYTEEDKGVVIEITRLLNDLEEELMKY
ncbi:MAG: DUF2750 domain-containing protein [Clostridiaceae bacterium]